MELSGRNLFLYLLLFGTLPAHGAPRPTLAPEAAAVYTKPYSGIPTGHYSIPYLQSRLIRKDSLSWAFVKDSKTGKMGWTPRDQLLSPLHFSTKAKLLGKSPIFRERTDRRPDASLTPEQEITVQLLHLYGEWATISLHDTSAWVHVSYLLPVEKDPGYFFAQKNMRLLDKPRLKAKTLISIVGGQKLIPIKVSHDWAFVEYEGHQGYVQLENIVHRLHIANKVKTPKGLVNSRPELIHEKIFAVYVDPLWLGTGINPVQLYAAPNSNAQNAGTIPPWSNLQQQESLTQEWAISEVDSLGQVWWQSEKSSLPTQPWKTLAQQNMKIVLHNPLFPNLRIGLADTLYRSTDGTHWAPLRNLQNPQPAFAYSKDGILFVDDTLSVDNGETLTPFILWETVLSCLRRENIGIAENLKIINIYSMNGSSQQLVYELDVGAQRPIKIYTANRGINWSLLR